MISKFFIDRPVLSNVLAMVIVLIGLVSLFSLPVAQYPNVVPPTVQVTTSYPGASARDVMNTVALPIEQQVNGVERMIYMQSTSASDGSYTLTVTFEIGTDLNFAQILVQNRVAAALSALPQSVQAQGVTVQKKSTAILEIATLTASDPRLDSLFLSNYATINLQPELARLPGVGQVSVFGAGQYAMRIWLDPQLLHARGLTAQDVVNAVQLQSQQVSAGQVGAPPAPPYVAFQLTVNVAGRFDQADQFADIIVKTSPSGGVTRVRDIGRVELGAQSYGQAFTLNGRPAAGVAIYQTPGANALDVARTVQAKMAGLAKAFPAGVTFSVPFDTTRFVSASINEVYKTLFEAAALVLVVILVFLQDWRATLVPATTVPVTIIGAFAAMAALGFTVNLSTLFAIVLAIGIVVDDAIVIVEGTVHHIERHLSPHDAAVQAMNELLGPVIGITLVLMAVFIPASFLPGLTGQLYAQFALVIAATALISAINAATLKPTQCALWLRPAKPPAERNAFYRGFNAVYDRLDRFYGRLIGLLVRNVAMSAACALLLIALAFWGLSTIPGGFLPLEDQGFALVSVQLPDGAALGRTEQVMDQVQRAARAVPGVDQVIGISGLSALDNNASLSNAGVAYVVFKDWAVRGSKQGLRTMYVALNAAMDNIETARTLVIIPPAIQGIGNAGGFTLQVQLRDGSTDFAKLGALTRTIVADATAQSGLQRVFSSYRASTPQLDLAVDRVKAEKLQVTTGQVFQALSSYLGSTYVGQINKFGRTFQVYVQAEADFRARVSDIGHLPLRTSGGGIVPMGSLATAVPAIGPSLISLYNLYPSSSIVGSPTPGFSSGQALNLMDQICDQTLPTGTGCAWTAMSYQEKAVGNQLYYTFGLAVLLVYLVLAGQYESWLAPISIVLAVPLALLGPVAVLHALRLDNNLYTQIGIILLIALAAKNAILIVEVAREQRIRNGKPIVESAVLAARARLRPILMTSLAFILGMMPLVLATGAGANARKSIGITAVSGMLASTLLAVLLVPSFFVVVQRLEERRRPAKAPIPAQAE